MKAIILAGGENAFLSPLTKFCPKPMLPFLNRPLLESQLRCLRQNGFNEIGIALSPQDVEQVTAYLEDGKRFGLKINYAVDDIPKGPAGSLKLFEEFIGEDHLVVINGNVYLGSIDLSHLIRFHQKRKALATLGMYKDESRPSDLENVVILEQGRIRGFEILYPYKDKQIHHKFGGIYLFDNSILKLISSNGYVDIKEQLIAELHNAGHPIFGHPISGLNATIGSIEDYYKAQHRILHRGLYDGNGDVKISDTVWVGKDTRISSSAYILGPVLIGKNCNIDDHVQIIGPAVVGDHCEIGERSLVRESIIWNNTQLSKGSKNEYCIIGSECHVPTDQRAKDSLVIWDAAPAKYSLLEAGQISSNGMPHVLPLLARLRYQSGMAIKRVIDIMVSTAGLVASAPLFLVIGLAVKLSSRGPVFYIQRRCGKNGKEFKMIKFRTMVEDAEEMHKNLVDKKDIDGPMFKMENDPRLTKIGKFLRKMSLDEIPQLFNVLKGEMSLVGPRPLIMDEMKFSPSWRDIRLKVKPGITGLWQIQGRSKTFFHDWIRYDVSYVKSQSLWFDIKILIKTIWVTLKRAGAL